MKCAEFREQVAAFALGALDPEERAAFAAHLASTEPHEGCREALAEAQGVMDALLESVEPVVPRAEVWKRIEAETGPGRRSGIGLVPWLVAAAALVGLWFSNEARLRHLQERTQAEQALANVQKEEAAERDRCRQKLETLAKDLPLTRDALALLAQPATRVVTLAPQSPKGAPTVALVNPNARRAIVLSAALAPQPGKDYELWVIRGKSAPVPAGFLRQTAPGMVMGEIDRTLLAGELPDALAVSLEPAGGRPTPTEVLLVGKVRG